MLADETLDVVPPVAAWQDQAVDLAASLQVEQRASAETENTAGFPWRDEGGRHRGDPLWPDDRPNGSGTGGSDPVTVFVPARSAFVSL